MTNKRFERSDFWIIQIDLIENAPDMVYLLFFIGDTDRPAIYKNELCFFSRQTLSRFLNKYIEFSPADFDSQVDLVYKWKLVKELIHSKSIDNNATLINSINILLDMINALDHKLSSENTMTLNAFANHLTFSKRYGGYLNSNNLKRIDLINIFQYINGIIISNASYVDEKMLLKKDFSVVSLVT